MVNQEEIDRVTVVLKGDESTGVMQDPLEKAESGNKECRQAISRASLAFMHILQAEVWIVFVLNFLFKDVFS